MKTIVAFANTQGGKLIVGVYDKTHQIVGVENDVLFQLMDGIANAVLLSSPEMPVLMYLLHGYKCHYLFPLISEEATEKLCQDIEKFRKKAGMSEHSVKKEQLINWKILKQSEGQLLATNAYALLTSDYFSFSNPSIVAPSRIFLNTKSTASSICV